MSATSPTHTPTPTPAVDVAAIAIERALDMGRVVGGGVVLDASADPHAAARRVTAAGRVLALAPLGATHAAEAPAHVQVRSMRVDALDLPGDTFDAALWRRTADDDVHVERALACLRRVLKSGGRVVVIVDATAQFEARAALRDAGFREVDATELSGLVVVAATK